VLRGVRALSREHDRNRSCSIPAAARLSAKDDPGEACPDDCIYRWLSLGSDERYFDRPAALPRRDRNATNEITSSPSMTSLLLV